MKNNGTNRMKQNAGLTVRLLMVAVICIAVSACAGSVQPEYPERDLESTTAEVIAGASTDAEKLERLFLYVRDEIDFNWIYPQNVPPEDVLKNGFGVCMQKANLLSTMARQAGFQTRFRFIYVHKQALEDFLPAFAYGKWADPFPHTVVEIMYQGAWRSFDPSFDQRLYEICLDKKINFARYPEIVKAYQLGFSPEGMKGTQEFWEVTDKPSFYGNTLDPLLAWEEEHVCFFKRLMKPFIFRQARSIMDAFRG
ncbi:MAG: transglutaminase domain-containing protein [Deltaproteobacteria bacterium]|nr:transglutaminase domain-containing protein [Deltaproteobacteria bacterium]